MGFFLKMGEFQDYTEKTCLKKTKPKIGLTLEVDVWNTEQALDLGQLENHSHHTGVMKSRGKKASVRVRELYLYDYKTLRFQTSGGGSFSEAPISGENLLSESGR